MHLAQLQKQQMLTRCMLYSLLLCFCIFSASSTTVYAHDNSLINDYSCEVGSSDGTDNSATIESKLPLLVNIQLYSTSKSSEQFQQKVSRKSLSNRDPPSFFII